MRLNSRTNFFISGISLVRGLYYDWPTFNEAYQFPAEYLFGDDMVVRPVTSPVNSTTGLVQVSVRTYKSRKKF
jgi:alpha-glucosidase (family GH31 glycosyl hydrolase)